MIVSVPAYTPCGQIQTLQVNCRQLGQYDMTVLASAIKGQHVPIITRTPTACSRSPFIAHQRLNPPVSGTGNDQLTELNLEWNEVCTLPDPDILMDVHCASFLPTNDPSLTIEDQVGRQGAGVLAKVLKV